MANLSEIMGTKIWADKPADWRPTTNEQSAFFFAAYYRAEKPCQFPAAGSTSLFLFTCPSSACLGVGSDAAVAVQGGGAEKYQPVVRDWVWLEGVPVTADGGLCFRLPTHLFGWAQVLGWVWFAVT